MLVLFGFDFWPWIHAAENQDSLLRVRTALTRKVVQACVHALAVELQFSSLIFKLKSHSHIVLTSHKTVRWNEFCFLE